MVLFSVEHAATEDGPWTHWARYLYKDLADFVAAREKACGQIDPHWRVLEVVDARMSTLKDPDCPKCGWGPIGCQDERSGCTKRAADVGAPG